MNKTNIEWTDYSWNPIKGLCPVGCWYCYARKIYKRFDIMGVNTIRSQQEKILLDIHELRALGGGFRRSDCGPRKPSKIFVCSTIEIFHSAIPKDWRDDIFKIIEKNERHTFQILTKMPQNIDRPMPDNVWLGVSVTDRNSMWKLEELLKVKAKKHFVSFEPLLDNVTVNPRIINLRMFNWIIVGGLTGHGKKWLPDKKAIEKLVYYARDLSIPIFLKNNLKDIWGENLIQEFPE